MNNTLLALLILRRFLVATIAVLVVVAMWVAVTFVAAAFLWELLKYTVALF